MIIENFVLNNVTPRKEPSFLLHDPPLSLIDRESS